MKRVFRKTLIKVFITTVMLVLFSGMLTFAAKPKLSSFKVTYSGGGKVLKAGSGRYIKIKVRPKSAVKTAVEIKITNASGETVFQKSFAAAKNKTRSVKWYGKDGSAYVPSGKYKVKVTVTNNDKKRQKITKSKTVKVQAPADPSAAVMWGSKMYLTDPVTDYMAEMICRKVLTKSMTTKQKMQRLYEYVTKLSVHYGTKKQVGKIDFKLESQATRNAIAAMTAANKKLLASGKAQMSYGYRDYYGARGEEYNYSAGDEEYYGNYFLQTGIGDCIGVSGAYAILLGHIGVEAGQIQGRAPGNSNHIWNVVNFNGKWYFCDCDAENDNYVKVVKKNGKLWYGFFLKGTKLFKGYGFVFNNKPDINGKSVTIQKNDVK